MKSHPNLLFAALVAAFLAPAVVPLRSQDDARALATKDWPTVGGDWGNTRYSTLIQINAQTVSKLGGAWMAPKFDDGGAGRAMPVIKNGVLFITAGSWVYAYNAKTGSLVWKYQSGAPPAGPGIGDSSRSGQGLPAREGVAVAEGLVFLGLLDAHVIALREKTGELVWTQYVGEEPRRRGQGASGAPVYADGLVYIGLAADAGYRGKIVALDAKTGRMVWHWYVVPGPGEPGHETWPKNNDSWKAGGGAVWLVGAADPELGLVYFGTGNGVPQYGGDDRAGDNLYLCSVVALDMKTGKLRWHYQTVRHDVWEADIAISPVLYDATVAGRTRKAVAAMRADGYLFLLDRETGKSLLPIENRKVPQDARGKTVLTQPFPVGAERMLPDCDEWRKQQIPS